MKVALVHDWLTGRRGGEKCLEALCELYDDADLFTLIHVPGSVSPLVEERRVTTSPLQHVPGARRWYRFLLPLMPSAIESLDLSPYDLVVSTSHCVAKGVLTRPDALHVCYVHTPMRYAWDQWPQYFSNRSAAYRFALAPLLNYLRTWDVASASRVDRFVANSRFVARRVEKYYGRSSTVIHPPVDTDFFTPGAPGGAGGEPGDYYLMVAAMVPYKGIDLAIEAFNKTGKPLRIVGDGHLRRKFAASAGPTVEFTGRVTDEELREQYRGCRAVIQAGAEDFGIVPLEAQATGRPVIALGRAGALDTVRPLNRHESFLSGIGDHPSSRHPAPTGVFFYEFTAESLATAVGYFEENEASFDPEALREHALAFDRKDYKNRMQALIRETLNSRDELGRARKRRIRAEQERRMSYSESGNDLG